MYKQIHGTAFLTRLDTAEKAAVNIESFCDFFLCVAIFYAELTDAFTAFFAS